MGLERDESGRPTTPLTIGRLLAVTAYWLALTGVVRRGIAGGDVPGIR